MAGQQLLAVSGARWAWYSTEEHLPDDLEPIGTHLGPKQQTDKLFFIEINCPSRPSTHYNKQLRSDQLWILFHLLAKASGPQGMVHYSGTLTR